MALMIIFEHGTNIVEGSTRLPFLGIPQDIEASQYVTITGKAVGIHNK